MKYKYTTVSGARNTDGRSTKRPVIEVEVSYGSQSRKFLGLIDSGADQVIMPAAIADVLGINRNTCPKRSTMGIDMQPMESFTSEVTLRLADQTDSFKATVVFIDTDVPVLLGREGFFDHYRIKFEQDHDTFEITPVKKK